MPNLFKTKKRLSSVNIFQRGRFYHVWFHKIVCHVPCYVFHVLLPVWADSENGVNGSDFSKEKILRKRSSAHAQLIKISHFYVKTGHSGKLIVQSGLFICRSENTFKCFIRHVSTECIWQKYTFVGQIKFYLLSKFVNSVSDDEANKVNKLMFFPWFHYY